MKVYPYFEYEVGQEIRITNSHQPWKILARKLLPLGEVYTIKSGYTTFDVQAKEVLSLW